MQSILGNDIIDEIVIENKKILSPVQTDIQSYRLHIKKVLILKKHLNFFAHYVPDYYIKSFWKDLEFFINFTSHHLHQFEQSLIEDDILLVDFIEKESKKLSKNLKIHRKF